MRTRILAKGGYPTSLMNTQGGTMIGPLYLLEDPQQPMEASTKQYIDNSIVSINANNVTSGTLPVGQLPALTGDLTTVNGSNVLSLATLHTGGTLTPKVHVDAKGRVIGSSALVANDIPALNWNKLNTHPTTLSNYGITDAFNPSLDTALTGNLILDRDPTVDLQAATKRYVDSLYIDPQQVPVGTFIAKPADAKPTGFLRCNGAELNKADYPALYDVLSGGGTADLNSFSYALPNVGAPWQQQYDVNLLPMSDPINWTANGSLPIGLSWSQAVVTKNRVYLLGGWMNNNSFTSGTYTAPINADGTLGTWTSGNPLPGVFSHSRALVIRNHVYLLGGYNGTTCTTTVYMAPINADGTIGTWTTTALLPNPINIVQAFYTGNYIYVISGFDNNNNHYLNTVYRATVNSDGTLSNWISCPPLAVGVDDAHIAVTKNQVYILGGRTLDNVASPTVTNTVQVAPINSDGSLGTWVTTTPLPGPVCYSHVYVTRNRIFLFGGYNGTTYLNSIYTAPIHTDGTIGAWTTASTTLPVGLGVGQLIATNDHLHILGGQTSTNYTSFSSTIYTATLPCGLNDYSSYYGNPVIIQNRSLGTTTQPGSGKPWKHQYDFNYKFTYDIVGWKQETSFPIAIAGYQVLVTNHRVYVIGGRTTGDVLQSNIYTALINSDGTLSTWSISGSFPVPIDGHELFVTKNRVYVVGGESSYLGTPFATVYTTTINPDGTLGTWTTGPALPEPTLFVKTFITGNYVYLIAGENVSRQRMNKIYRAPINADGTLGSWVLDNPLPTMLIGTHPVITKNRVYVFSGVTDSDIFTPISYTALINTDGTIGTWETAPSVCVPMVNAYCFSTNSRIYMLGGDTTGYVFTSTVQLAVVFSDGTIRGWEYATSLPFVTGGGQPFITNNRLYLIGGYSGTLPNLTILNSVYSLHFPGGLNDYSPFYNGTLTPTDVTTFNLPELEHNSSTGYSMFVKY